ncbi:unnamed protein product [Orchesella dallaii]|uniref:Gustatory receptor n=1 Tax=Orchesella dallaii TaxID=48710 RepID=A0ABP1PWF8_9HEXA
MIEPEASTSLRVLNTDSVSIGDINSTTIKTDNRNFDNIISPQNLFVTNTIINGGKWVFLSNRLVAYWPFAINTIQDSHQKFLSFRFPTIGLVVTISYILLNISYMGNYFIVKFDENNSKWQGIDQICLMLWDSMVIGGGTLCRIYGIWRISKLHLFWNNVVNIVGQCTNLSSERETEEKFRKLEKWGLKWFVTFTAIGIISGSASLYDDVYNYNPPLLKIISIQYIDTVISSHNASAFFLIFFIKIMTHGFTICHTNLKQISKQCKDNTAFSNQNFNDETVLSKIFKLIRDLEECVENFNTTFVFILFMEISFSFWQVMFALYFFNVIDPLSNVLAGINVMMSILSYTTCLVCLCNESSKLTGECQEMVSTFQELPISTAEDERKVKLLVSRLTSEPPGIQVSKLIDIRESLLGSALNTLATYFIVLVQMRQMAQETNPGVTDANQANGTEIAPQI